MAINGAGTAVGLAYSVVSGELLGKIPNFSVSLPPQCSVGPKQLCVLAHPGCTREAGTFYYLMNTFLCSPCSS